MVDITRVSVISMTPMYIPTNRESSITREVIFITSCLDGQETLAISRRTWDTNFIASILSCKR